MRKEDVLKIVEVSVKSIAASFPIASSLATGWSEYQNEIQKRNIESILDNFFDRLSFLENQIDNSYLESDKLKSLIIKTCFYGKEELAEDKRKLLGQFLATSCLKSHSEDLIKHSILETLIKLSEFDVYILRKMADNLSDMQKEMFLGKSEYKPNEIAWGYWPETLVIEKLKPYKERDILSSLQYLNSIGVIENMNNRSPSNVDFYTQAGIISYELKQLNKEKNRLTSKSNKTNSTFQEIKDIEKQIKDLEENDYNEFNYDIEISYAISILGLNLLDYIGYQTAPNNG